MHNAGFRPIFVAPLSLVFSFGLVANQIWERQSLKDCCNHTHLSHSVRAALRDRWEDLCKQVPGEQMQPFIIQDFSPSTVTSSILNLTNWWQAHADGVGVACRGECPCPTDGDFPHSLYSTVSLY